MRQCKLGKKFLNQAFSSLACEKDNFSPSLTTFQGLHGSCQAILSACPSPDHQPENVSEIKFFTDADWEMN
jgi:hypothetical protein